MTGSTRLRVACVGAGYFSRFHYDSWARMENVDLVGSCNRDIEKARSTGLAAYDDVGRMIEETRPDLLDVILPPTAHASTIRTALQYGVRNIICQKPFCQSLEEARAIVALSKEVGARIVVHENFRFQPWYRSIKTALDNGAIGTVLQATFRLRPGDGQGPRAYMDRQPYFQQMERFLVHETAVHWVDTFRFLFGTPRSVYADLRRINPVIAGEDAGYMIFEYSNGLRTLFDGNRHLDHASDNLRRTMGEALFEGTTGTLTLAGDGAVHLRKFGTLEPIVISPPDLSPTFGGDCVHFLQRHVVSGLLYATPLENLAEDYLSVIATELAIYNSAQAGRKVELDCM